MSEKVDIWMPLYVKDYLAATSRLTTEQHGAYLLLIMDYWLNGPPPDDDAILSSIVHLTPDQWTKHRPSIERLFKVASGEWRHTRIEKEIAAARDRRKQAIERGKKGAAARWESKDRASIDEAKPKHSSKDSSAPAPTSPKPKEKSKPLSRSQNREPDRADDIHHVFQYWQQFMQHPRAKLDDKRRRKIRDRLKDGYEIEDLVTAIEGCAKDPFNMGENDNGKIYDDIELICRDATHVDRFIKAAHSLDTTKMSSAARRTAQAASDWITEGNS